MMKKHMLHLILKWGKASSLLKTKAFLYIAVIIVVSLVKPTMAQSTGISIDFKEIQLEQAIKQIEAQSGYHFLYNNALINAKQQVSAFINDATIESVLNEILKGTNINYKIDDKQVVLFLKDTATNSINSGQQTTNREIQSRASNKPDSEANISQDRIIVKGKVTATNDSQPLGYATVVIKGSLQHAITDAEGNYSIKAYPNDILVFSMVGYISYEQSINNKTVINVNLRIQENILDNIVVIGYGKTSQRMNTGSVSSVTSKIISEHSSGEALSAIQGRVSGLYISSTSGMPGSSHKILLRGLNSMNEQGNDPLFIIDGVPFASESLSQLSRGGIAQSPLNTINPSDIERIDVLKDADATAIYGSRGANGVILITTKSGRPGKTRFDFEIYSSVGKVARTVDMLTPNQYNELRKEAYANDGVTPEDTKAPDLLIWDKNKNTDWQKYLTGRTANITDMKLSISGGGERTNFLLSGSYRFQDNVILGDSDYKRGGLHFNVNHRSADEKFSLTASVNYNNESNNSHLSGLAQYYNLPTNLPTYDENENLYWYENLMNPTALTKQKFNSKSHTLIGNSTLSYTVIEGLDAKISLGYTYSTMDQIQTLPKKSFNPVNYTASSAYYGSSNSTSYIIEPQLTYTRNIFGGTLSALLGATWQENHLKGSNIEGTGYSNDNLLESMKSASTITIRNTNDIIYRYQSVFARLNYTWQDRYLLNLTYRRDGSSRFGPNNRFGNFGAIGAGWIISTEPFFDKLLPVINFAKLRVSYGITGNDKIDDYAYLDSWSSNSFSYGGISGLSPARLSNNDYKWEENKKFEVGLELAFLENRFFIKTDYYQNRSGNLLVYHSLSAQTGFQQYRANLPALIKNTGWEFDVNASILQGGIIKWESGFNLSIPKNKLLKYPGLENSSYADKYVIGQPIDIVKGYHFLRVDPQTGLATFLDINKDEAWSDPDDFVILGSESPKLHGGFWNTITYRNLELNFLFQFVKQDGPSINYGYMASPNGSLYNSTTEALKRWKKPGDITNVPRATATSSNEAYINYHSYYRLSDAVWGDASFIRLKNIMLTYDLSSWSKRFNLSRLNIYIQAQNLFTISNYIGFDPETKGLEVPPLRTFTAGIRLSF